MSVIKPQIPKGFRDFLPAQNIIRQGIIDVVRTTFETFGFEPLGTPCIEYAETLEGKYGEEGERLIYKFEDRGGRNVALRYDLTIPLCRVISMYPEIVKPFKCYQIAPVWRADKPQKGRYREFYQCDIDIIGSDSMMADAELIVIIYRVLSKLGFKDFTIRINNRKLLNALAIKAGITDDEVAAFLRTLDKLDKIGTEGVRSELTDKGFTNTAIDNVFGIFNSEWQERNIPLDEIKELIKGIAIGEQGVNELLIIQKALKAQTVPEDCYCFDLTLARGLDYYTGPVFETVIKTPKVGSITGGGRYDNLIGLFSKTPFPATGTSFGLERLVAVAEEMEKDAHKNTRTQVLVAFFDEALMDETLKLAQMMRNEGLRTEVYFAAEKLKKQLSYAAQKGIPLVVLLGPDEIRSGTVMLRNMRIGRQDSVSREDLVNKIREQL